MADFPMDPNLVIDDDYITDALGTQIESYLKRVEEYYNKYIEILEKVKRMAVISGDTADALGEFIVCAKKLSGFLTDYSEQLKMTCESYISEINQCDNFEF